RGARSDAPLRRDRRAVVRRTTPEARGTRARPSRYDGTARTRGAGRTDRPSGRRAIAAARRGGVRAGAARTAGGDDARRSFHPPRVFAAVNHRRRTRAGSVAGTDADPYRLWPRAG